MDRIRVMVVDDSALMRKLISDILAKDPGLDVVGTAMDGLLALKKIPQARPDVITLDLDMPRMDGLTALRFIVGDYRIPVVLVSSHTTAGGALTLEGLALGAVDFVTKPRCAISDRFHEVAHELIEKVKMASSVPARKLIMSGFQNTPRQSPRIYERPIPIYNRPSPKKHNNNKIVAIGISTGGPNALSHLLPQLPSDFPAAILIVQHMPEGFTRMFASRLNELCKLSVKEAKDDDQILPGHVFIAPGNHHLQAVRSGSACVVALSSSLPVNGHRPSVDVLFESVSREYGPNAVGLIMTGMGEDGARGLGMIKDSGGYTLAQDEESSVVYGMPKVAVEMGNVHEVVSLDYVTERLTDLVKGVTAYAGRAEQTI